ncbi:MAG TPA: TetR/AcrR family transcriptional regulator, partial [Acidimicrobiales bacterium]
MPTQAERTEATRSRLVTTARHHFAEKGFAATSTEEILAEADVSRGAMYHHFEDKQALFRATFEAVEADLTARVREAAISSSNPVDQLRQGFAAYLDQCRNPEVQRIVLLDGPTVLGWDIWHAIDERYV